MDLWGRVTPVVNFKLHKDLFMVSIQCLPCVPDKCNVVSSATMSPELFTLPGEVRQFVKLPDGSYHPYSDSQDRIQPGVAPSAPPLHPSCADAGTLQKRFPATYTAADKQQEVQEAARVLGTQVPGSHSTGAAGACPMVPSQEHVPKGNQPVDVAVDGSMPADRSRSGSVKRPHAADQSDGLNAANTNGSAAKHLEPTGTQDSSAYCGAYPQVLQPVVPTPSQGVSTASSSGSATGHVGGNEVREDTGSVSQVSVVAVPPKWAICALTELEGYHEVIKVLNDDCKVVDDGER